MRPTFRSVLFLVLFLVAGAVVPSKAVAERRVALVIGNAAYQRTTPLKNPVNDATSITAALRRLKFDVVTALDLQGDKVAEVLGDFARGVQGADVALFFYAGHGLQLNERNYLVAVDARLVNEFALERETYPMDRIMEIMESSAKISLLFIDACRNNPLVDELRRSIPSPSRSAQVGRALARMEAKSRDTLIVFATALGKIAEDGGRPNSPFTEALLKHIETPDVDVEVMLKDVTSDVRRATNDRQSPERLSRLESKFQFKPDGGIASDRPTKRLDDKGEEERLYWESVKDSKNTTLLHSYLERYPQGVFADIARSRIEELENPSKEDAKLDPDRAFEAATKDGTLEAYERFVDAFPDDPRAGRLRNLVREEQLWRKAQSEDTVAAHRNYMAAFPKGIYVAQAEQRIAALTKPVPTEQQGRSVEFESTPSPPPVVPSGPSMWDHNGSKMKLVVDRASRRFYYEWPRPGMIEEGVQTGTLLFDGTKSGTNYSGTAYVFSMRCGASPYRVSGSVSTDQRRVVLYGKAPSGFDRQCRVARYRSDVLVFDFVSTAN